MRWTSCESRPRRRRSLRRSKSDESLDLRAVPRRDVSGRPLELQDVPWSQLFDPKTVAVVGASETEGTQQRRQWTQVRDRLGARGATVVPVHPTKSSILGTPTYPSVVDVPFDI